MTGLKSSLPAELMLFDSFVRSPQLGRLDFRIHNVSLCIVNAVRRAILADVTSAAFRYDICVPDKDDTGITVVSNTSTLHNEMLAHRLSFVPIHLSEDEQQRFQAQPDRFKFTIRLKNKGAAGAAVVDVTSRDIQVTDKFGAPLEQKVRDAMFPPDKITGDHILLVCLRPSPTGDGLGEEIFIDATASESNGHENCRWSPVSLCSFRNVVDDRLASDAYALLNSNKVDGDAPIQSRAQFDTLDAHRCYSRDAYGDPFVFDFSIETLCGLRPEFIFYKALRILSDRVAQLARAIRTLDDPDTGSETPSGRPLLLVKLEPISNSDDFFILTIAGEGHTLGNLVQGLMYNSHVRDDLSKRLTFVGYHVAHPLDQSICMKFKVVPGIVITDFLVEALDGIVAHLNSVTLEWTHPSSLDVAGIRDVDSFIANIPSVPE